MLIYRQGNMFKIDESKLSSAAKNTATKNALYAAVYDEFKGANENPLYKSLSPIEKMNELNQFAENWLKDKVYHNGTN